MTGEPLPQQEPLPTFTYPTPETLTAGAEARIACANALQAEIVAATESAVGLTYENTVGKLGKLQDELGWEGEAGREEMLMAAVHPDEAIRKSAKTEQGRLQERWRDTLFDTEVYRVIKAFSETDAAANLEPEQLRALQDTMLQFKRAGQELDVEQREQLRGLQTRLDKINSDFIENIAKDTPELTVEVDELGGLPEKFVADLPRPKPEVNPEVNEDDAAAEDKPIVVFRAPPGMDLEAAVATARALNYLLGLTPPAEAEGAEGPRVITLTEPRLNTILAYADSRELREKAFVAFNSVAQETNRPLLLEAAELRMQIANMLGYESWAHMQLEGQMAGDPATVKAFYDELTGPLQAKVAVELEAMQPLLAADGPVQVYDTVYYARKMRESLGVDDLAIAEYMPLDAVLEGMFSLSGELFGVRFEELQGADTWHEDVRVFQMHDATSGDVISTFYLDLFPRAGKRTSAATYTLQYGNRVSDGAYNQPITAIIANVTPPPKDGATPALMQPSDLRQIFHEFGHVLHKAFARTETLQFAGDNTEVDFREAPSQMFEQLALRPAVLQRLGRHWETNEPIPPELVENMLTALDINSGINGIKQIRLGAFDLGLHDASTPKDLGALYRLADALSGTPQIEGIDWTARFRHLAMDNYAGLYHQYPWSLVYTAEILAAFTDPNANPVEVGHRYRQMMTLGGALPAAKILEDFLGRAPDQNAYLRSLGPAA